MPSVNHPGINKLANGWFISRMLLVAALFLALNALVGVFYFIVPGNIYPTVHMILEFTGVIVAMSVSLMSWYDYKYQGEAGVLILSVVFVMVGMMDFAHSLSYFGMPDFFGANSVNKASTFWILARIIQATGILAAVAAGQRRYSGKKSAFMPLMAIIVTLLSIYLTVICEGMLPPMYDPVLGVQTSLKVYLEYAVMAVMAAATLLILQKADKNKGDFDLAAALLAGIMSEMAFTLYSNAYDAYNLLGHLYKVLSFVFILRALVEEALEGIYRANHELVRKGEELAEANRQLRAADRLKDEFLANTNHELKTPLSAIIAFSELMADEENAGQLNELQRDYLKEIRDSAQALLDRINGLLCLTGIMGGKVVLCQEKMSLKEMVSEVVARNRPAFVNKGINLDVTFADGEWIVGDKEKLSMVLNNLLTNALKFTDPGGTVAVCAGVDREAGSSFFSISDTGIGIEPGQTGSIYKMFYQVDGASTRRQGGTGIGLTLAARLVEMHHGRIELESEYGKGSKFTVILPLIGLEEDKTCPQK